MKWRRLEVRRCESLHQSIRIPEMDVTETITHRFYLDDEENSNHAIIYISEHGQHFMTVALSEALEKYWGIPQIATQIDKILCTPLTRLDELLSSIYKIPELLSSWKEMDSEDIVAPSTRGNPPIGRADGADATVSSFFGRIPDEFSLLL